MHSLIQRMILYDTDRYLTPTRYFFLAVATATEEPQSPQGNFCIEADVTQNNFALKAFPIALPLNLKKLLSVEHIELIVCAVDSGLRQLAIREWAPRTARSVCGAGGVQLEKALG